MATITDTLQTVFEFAGAAKAVEEMDKVVHEILAIGASEKIMVAANRELEEAIAVLILPLTRMQAEFKVLIADLINAILTFQALAAAEGVAAAATGVLDAALALLQSPILLIGAALAGLAVATAGVVEGFNEAAKAEDDFFRSAIAFRNLGSFKGFEELLKFADELNDKAAVSEEEVVALGAALLRLGVSGVQLEPALKAIVDFAQGTGQSIQQATQEFESALVGRGLFLKRLGIEFKATGDHVRDVIALTKEFERVFAGAAEARLKTPAGQIDALKIAFQEFLRETGNLFEGLFLPRIKQLLEFLKEATENIEKLEDFFHIPRTAARAAQAAGLDENTPAGRAARETANNTAEMKKLMKEGFNVGPQARAAFNTRALRAALRGAS